MALFRKKKAFRLKENSERWATLSVLGCARWYEQICRKLVILYLLRSA
jgi:hypothetical protein